MATLSMVLKMCSALNCKRDANALCLHCNTYVCTKHYLEHVKIINDELVPLSDQLNSIVNTLRQFEVTGLTRNAVEQLENWRKESHRRIDELCDEKKGMLEKIARLKLDEEKSNGKQLSNLVQELINQNDASHQQVEQLKKDIKTLESRCAILEKSDFLHVDMKPIELFSHSMVIKARRFSFFTGGGSLLCLEYQLQINNWIGRPEQKWRLLYKGKRDGFKAEDFHRCSDDEGPTLTVIQAKEGEWLFGGYTSESWTSKSAYVQDNAGPFLFTLTNPHNISSTRYMIEPTLTADAVVHNPTYGPTFGNGFDLHVCNESHTTQGSYFKFPSTYNDITGKGALTFTGNEHFETSDLEVYRFT